MQGTYIKRALIPPVPGAGFHLGPTIQSRKKGYAGSPPVRYFMEQPLMCLSNKNCIVARKQIITFFFLISIYYQKHREWCPMS